MIIIVPNGRGSDQPSDRLLPSSLKQEITFCCGCRIGSTNPRCRRGDQEEQPAATAANLNKQPPRLLLWNDLHHRHVRSLLKLNSRLARQLRACLSFIFSLYYY
mmetsp:Transcript_26735/g.73724  ORF Transcript_26735/g.73724 Transcript_26735/m.73724 type:complete len:104 (+) Transcript_26735:585-896(+)